MKRWGWWQQMAFVFLSALVVATASAISTAASSVPATTPRATATSSSKIVFAADRLPPWNGEIYRVTASGKRLDLSSSPAPDISPSVAPNGRWVAFFSGRGGSWAFYVVGSNGRDLHRVSQPLSALDPTDGVDAAIVWAPDSRHIAAEASVNTKSLLYLGSLTDQLHPFANNVSITSWLPQLAWSPDGQLLAYATEPLADSTTGLVKVISAAGKHLWSVTGSIAGNAWSADDRLAVAADSQTANVYGSSGHLLSTFRADAPPTWSPGGSLLASAGSFGVQIRRDGVGTPTFDTAARNAGTLQWVGPTKLRYQGPNGWAGLDVATRSEWKVDAALPYNSIVSTTGQQLAEEQQGTAPSTLVLSSVGSTSSTVLATGPWTPDNEDFQSLAFLPDQLGLVYQTSALPSADIYSINADGSDLHRITDAPTDEIEPSLSPDGQTVVFVQQLVAGDCQGCAQTIWRVPLTGGTPTELTSHHDQDPAPFDNNPTWSPDGTQIAFQNSGVSSPLRLTLMPAAGGPGRVIKAKGVALPSWGPKLLAYGDWSVSHLVVNTLNPATGTIQTVASGGKTEAAALAWSNSDRLAYLYYDQRSNHALVAIVGSKAAPLDLSAHLPSHSRVAGLCWSPDGTKFAFTATDINGVGEIYTIATDGSDLRQLTHNIGALWDVSYESTISWR